MTFFFRQGIIQDESLVIIFPPPAEIEAQKKALWSRGSDPVKKRRKKTPPSSQSGKI